MQNESDLSLDGEENRTDNMQTNGALSIPLAALGFMTRLASGIFSRGQKNNELSSINSGGDIEVLPNNFGDVSTEALQTPTSVTREEHGVVEESYLLDASENLKDSSRSEVDNSSSFKGFDIVKDPLDHFYLCANGQVSCNFNEAYPV